MKRPRRGFHSALLWLISIGSGWGAVAGCGVLNPSLVSAISFGTAQTYTMDAAKGNIVILVMNLTPVTTQANVQVTRTNGGLVTLNISVPAFSHRAFTQECEVEQIEFVEASYASVDGAVPISFAISPVVSGVDLHCGDVVAITMLGTAPSILPQVQVF